MRCTLLFFFFLIVNAFVFVACRSVRWYLEEETPEPVKHRLNDRRHGLLLCACRCCRCCVAVAVLFAVVAWLKKKKKTKVKETKKWGNNEEHEKGRKEKRV